MKLEIMNTETPPTTLLKSGLVSQNGADEKGENQVSDIKLSKRISFVAIGLKTPNFRDINSEYIENTVKKLTELEAQAEKLEKENANLQEQNDYLSKQLEHVNRLPEMDFVKLSAQIFQQIAAIVVREPKAAGTIKGAMDALKVWESQQRKKTQELEKENESLKEKLKSDEVYIDALEKERERLKERLSALRRKKLTE